MDAADYNKQGELYNFKWTTEWKDNLFEIANANYFVVGTLPLFERGTKCLNSIHYKILFTGGIFPGLLPFSANGK